MNQKELIEHFHNQIVNSPQFSKSKAALESMLKFVELDKSETFMGFLDECQNAIKILSNIDLWSTSIVSSGEIFLLYITKANLFNPNFDECRNIMLSRGNSFLKSILKKQDILAANGVGIIKKKRVILTHGKCPRVFSILKRAKEENIQFTVYIVKGFENAGEDMLKWLNKENIKGTLIEDCQIGHYTTLADAVLIGAETICGAGGVLSLVGSYPLALAAKNTKTPFYVCVDGIKYTMKLTPDKQTDIPKLLKIPTVNDSFVPRLDYIPEDLITYITEYGIQKNAMLVNDLPQMYLS